jgi:NitT/TauT family transport system ATP-binding protein
VSSVRLRAEGIGHRFGALQVLADIELDIRPGEVTVLLGPSGCGKSTLLAILGGLLKPERGRVVVEGTPPPGCLNPLTYVFQDFALLPWRRVAANVSLVLEGRLPKPEREARIAEVLARLPQIRAAEARADAAVRDGARLPSFLAVDTASAAPKP